MSRLNPAPDAPWVELVTWEPRPRYRGARRAPTDLVWIDTGTAHVDGAGVPKAVAWRIRVEKHAYRYFEKIVARRWIANGTRSSQGFVRFGDVVPESDLTDWQPAVAKAFSAEIGWNDTIDDRTLREIGLQNVVAMGPAGIELLRMMKKRWRELYEQGPPKAKRKR